MFFKTGVFAAYVHQVYIKEIFNDVNIQNSNFNESYNIDLVILRNIRYLKPGIFLGLGYEWKIKNKLPLGVEFNLNGFDSLGWITINFYTKIDLLKK